MAQRYLVALGSNRRHPRHGRPDKVIAAALLEMELAGLSVRAVSNIVGTRPLGPSARNFANAAAVIETGQAPPALLATLLQIEDSLGRCRRRQRWSERVIDLDIVLWEGGCWADDDLVIPHPHMRRRAFVLGPAATIAGHWRDPLSGLTVRHLLGRLTRSRRAPKPRPTRRARRMGP